jgi:hypothetical protein
MNFKKRVLLAAVASALGVAGSAAYAQSALHLSEDGRGQVLIYPYYSSQNGNGTIFTVVNTTNATKAVKVRFLEGKNSREVLDFNLYLSPLDAWSGVVTNDGSGNPILRTFDKSCTAPAIPASATVAGATEVAFRNFEYSGYDMAGSGLDRAKEGYLEILEMGVPDGDDIDPSAATVAFNAAVTHAGGVPSNCAAVVNAWKPGGYFTIGTNAVDALSAPTGGLIGTGSVINVAAGTDYSYDPVVIADFTSVIRHTEPGSLFPSLAQADPFSLVFYQGDVVASNWGGVGVDAVSAVLMHQSVINEFTVNTSFGGGTDMVVTFPTKRFYVPRESDLSLATAPFTTEFDDTVPVGPGESATLLTDGQSAGACEPTALLLVGREEEQQSGDIDFSPKPPVSGFALCWEVNVLTINNTNVLQSNNLKTTITSPFTDGWLRLGFNDAGHLLADSNTTDDGVSTFTYRGLPAVGVAVQRYVNGNVGGVLSNYGGGYINKYERNITAAPAPAP